MSIHQRQKIRESVRKILFDQTDAGKSVYSNRATLSWGKELPVIVVFMRGESSSIHNDAPRQYKRTVEMVVEIGATGQEQPVEGETDLCGPFLEDVLDSLAAQVECELSRDHTVGDTASAIDLTGSEFDLAPEGKTGIGSLRVIYAVTYYEFLPDKIEKQRQANAQDLKSIFVGWDLDVNDKIIDAKDELDIP